MDTPHQAPGIIGRMPLILIIVTTLIALSASLASLLSGWLTIFQNLFYIPIILACYYYTRRGFSFSVLLSCTYFLLMLFASQDPVVLAGALVRVAIFIVVAGVITYISTGRIRAEEGLRESEARYRNLFESSRDAIMTLEPPAWRYTSGNRSAMQMFMAKDEEEFSSREPWTYSPELQPDGRKSQEKGREMIETAMHNGSHLFEWTHRRNNGEIFPATVLLSRVDLAGKVFLQATVRDITDRRQAEEQLRESEKKYRDFFTTSRDPVFITSPDGRWIDFNDSALEMFGYSSREELMSLPVAALYENPEDRRALMQRIETNDYVRDYPVRLTRKDGRVIDTLVTSVPLRGEDGVVTSFIGSIRDITDLRRAEERISHLNAVLRAIRDVNQLIAKETDRDRLLQGACQSLVETRGFGSAWIVLLDTSGRLITYEKAGIGEEFAAIVEPMTRGVLPECGRMAMARPEIWTADCTGDDCHHCPLVPGCPLTGGMAMRLEHGGKVYGFISVSVPARVVLDEEEKRLFKEVSTDIAFALYGLNTEADRRRAEEALAGSEERFRSYFESSPVGIFITDSRGRYLAVNPVACLWTGYSQEELLQLTIPDILDASSVKSGTEAFQRLIETGRSTTEAVFVRKDGTRFSMVVDAVRVHPDECIGFCRDITDLKQAEEALRKSEERYRELFESMSSGVAVYQAIDDGNDFVFKDFNRAAETIEEIQREDLIGRRVTEVFPGVTESGLLSVIQRVWRTGDADFLPELVYRDSRVRESWREAWVYRLPGGDIVAVYNDISGRKRAEEEIVFKNTLLETQQETSIDGILVVDSAGRIISYNSHFVAMWGISQEIIDSRSDERAIQAVLDSLADPEGFLKQVRFLYDHPQEKSREEIALKDGRVFDRYSAPMFGPGRAYYGRVWYFRDITDRRQAEHQVRMNAARNTVLLRLHMMGATASEQEILHFAMEGSLEITGSRFAFAGLINDDESEMTIHAWSKDVMEQCTITDKALVFPVKDLGILGECIRQRSPLIINEYTGPHPAKHGYPAGHVPIHRFMMVPLFDEDRIVAVAAVANKETEYTEDDTDAIARLYYRMWEIIARRRAEEALRDSEEQFRVIFHNQQTGLLMIDPASHRIMDANATALSMIGAPREDVVGRICHNFICPAEEGKCPVTDLGQVIDRSELILITKSGDRVPVLKSVNLITMKGKQLIIDSFIDITDRKRAEEALYLVNKKLQLMSSITRHDILNQLTILRGYLDLSGSYLTDPVRLQEYLEREERAAATIEAQIRFTRDYQDLGLQAPSWQSVSLNIEKAIAIIPMGTIRVEMMGSDVEIFADPLCEKVFFNLIDNAIRHGGDRMTTIRFSSRESEHGMTIVVEDDGAGISPADRKRLFERGFGKNTGLGLFLSREILSITGITITETGTEGQGARFEIAVPRGAYRNRKGT